MKMLAEGSVSICFFAAWLETEFLGGRHEKRVNMLMALEDEQ